MPELQAKKAKRQAKAKAKGKAKAKSARKRKRDDEDDSAHRHDDDADLARPDAGVSVSDCGGQEPEQLGSASPQQKDSTADGGFDFGPAASESNHELVSVGIDAVGGLEPSSSASAAPASPPQHFAEHEQESVDERMEIAHEPQEQPVQAPAAAPDLQVEPEHAAAPEEPPQPGAHRHVGPKVHSTPAEIMKLIEPCDKFRFFIDKNAHRFKVETRVSDDRFNVAPYKGKTFNRSFLNCSWRSALKLVHQHAWLKWALVRDTWPCDKDEQDPGVVPENVYQALAPIIAEMPQAVKYPRSS